MIEEAWIEPELMGKHFCYYILAFPKTLGSIQQLTRG